MNKPLPLVLIGGGGHASVLADILLGQGREILAVICPDDVSSRAVLAGIPHLTQDEDIARFSPDSVRLVNGIGMMPRSTFRQRINEKFLAQGYVFETVIASDAKVSSFAEVKSGAQIFPGARVQTGAVIGEHTIVNSEALIEHDCRIGAYNHIAPRATLCGQVVSEAQVFIGAGSTILPGINLGQSSIIGAGATILKYVPAEAVVVGKQNSKQ
ncbi:acetyltransferase [Vibrio vulnificus]|uniref:acetyltransferase n=1 Tax=Vibrio vulnificus TaxID=672 RepID=UPI0019D4A242|nr:acetyltransferase [Vibrio vulnificus]EJT0554803.1 acetyltransferase [Vibrio vulnificus]MBN8085963.1 acetyltransferase [Vibrio vulnificus]MBN8129037.1 acetyltransferase [Vibrio vulnificus]MBN8133483.1 acetyltransferase [Vibrio vulnificus]MBN8138088.1 acetyltransferase [Vibrio vulnificus]